MNRVYHYLFGDNVANYVEVGFSEEEARAMSWIAEQKPKGKFFGLMTGVFLAASWGHWHDRILSYFRFSFNKRFTQFFIISGCITLGDHIFVGDRTGGNQVLFNNLRFNNNLFRANLQSLVENFNVLNRTFTQQQIKLFNDRAISIRSNIDLKDRKWIYNPELYTREEFERRIRLSTNAPWTDEHISNIIKYDNIDRITKQLRFAPTKLDTLIDSKGDKLGIANQTTPFWAPIK